jgi:hypothetical protein
LVEASIHERIVTGSRIGVGAGPPEEVGVGATDEGDENR